MRQAARTPGSNDKYHGRIKKEVQKKRSNGIIGLNGLRIKLLVLEVPSLPVSLFCKCHCIDTGPEDKYCAEYIYYLTIPVLGDSSEDLAKFSQALLSDPLASDQSPSQALNARVQTARKVRNQEQVRKLRYNPPSSISTADTEDALTSAAVSSRFLADNNIELQEALFDSGQCARTYVLKLPILTLDAHI